MIKAWLTAGVVSVCSVVNAGQYADSAIQAARELAGAVKTGDMMWMIDKMYPPLKKQLVAGFPGGETALRESIQQAAAQMRAAQMVIESFEIGKPTAECVVKNGTEALVILPTRLMFSAKSPDGTPVKIEQNGAIVMVKDLKANGEWTMIDASSMNVNGLRSLFYDLPVTVEIPAPSMRQL